MAEITPMMKQYLEIKEQNKDSILFFRLGDFYEMFNEDAQLASRELDLTLTTRDRGKAAEDQTPMCGIPYHSSDAYIARLIAKGYKVAICEQMEDPATAKGLVQRDITRIITPGTVTESCMLDENKTTTSAVFTGKAENSALPSATFPPARSSPRSAPTPRMWPLSLAASHPAKSSATVPMWTARSLTTPFSAA